VEGMGIEFRSNRRKRSLAAFVGGIVRPTKGSGNLVGVAITSALTRSLKTLGYRVSALRRHASILPRVPAAYNPAKGLKVQAPAAVIPVLIEICRRTFCGAASRSRLRA
jgi:hypothetical protein